MIDQRAQLVGFAGKRDTGCIRFLHHGRILLRDLIHLVDGGVDLAQSG